MSLVPALTSLMTFRRADLRPLCVPMFCPTYAMPTQSTGSTPSPSWTQPSGWSTAEKCLWAAVCWEDVPLPTMTINGGVHVAVGTVSSGPAGFRDSHLEAARVVELVRSHSLTRAPGFLHYHDVELAALLTQDLDGARTFLRR